MRKNKFTIDRTPERVELMKLMASENANQAYEAQVAFAAFLRPIVQRLLDQKSTVGQIFRKEVVGKGAPRTILIDPYESYREGDFHVWSTTKQGGLLTQTVEGLTEYPFLYSNLDSALYLNKDYVEDARLDLMAKAINRVVQEFLAKEERLGWTALLTSLASAGSSNILSATTANRLQLDDFNRMKTLITRIYQSFAAGSIAGDYGLTDMYMSPERVADIRAWVYQPMNTISIPNTDESTVLALPDAIREEIFRAAGTMSLWGVSLHELRELGDAKKLGVIFDSVYAGTPTFTNATDDLVIGMDLSQDTAISPVEGDAAGATVKVSVDNQFHFNRTERLAWTFKRDIGYVIIDNRWLTGLIV